jgi:hypothetical protein
MPFPPRETGLDPFEDGQEEASNSIKNRALCIWKAHHVATRRGARLNLEPGAFFWPRTG